MEASRISRYQLLEEVGSGGMAVVYRGVDTTLEREVAVKILHPHLASREESRRRFSREARAVARLRHPNIVEIFDFSGDESKESFIVTEFVAGRTLRAFGDEVGFALPEIALLAAERLAEALEHAHEAGVVHRDLKPENVMVRRDGVLKLMDFGIARMIGKDDRMTMTGALVGSPLHMPPEVIEGREAGAPADLFSLGTILYWMVTGEMAFEGNNTTQTLRRILEGDYVDPRMKTPACSDEIAALIASCLARDPVARPASMAELRQRMRELLDEAGLFEPARELEAYFAEPESYAASLRDRLVDSLVERADEARSQKRNARAVALYHRALALCPEDERAAFRLERMRVGSRRRRRLAWAAASLGVLALLSGAVYLMPDEVAEAPEPPVVEEEEKLADASPPVLVAPPPTPDVPPSEAEAPREPTPTRPAVATAPAKSQPAAEVDETPQKVQLRWVPQGATLYLDGERIDTHAPAWNGELAPGRYTLRLEQPSCCHPFEEELVVADGPIRRSIALAPRESGWFLVESEQEDARVWFDGTYKGTVAEVNARGGVPVPFSRSDTGRERYVKTVRVQLLPPIGRDDLAEGTGEAVVRAGQVARTAPIALPRRDG